jgi:hypothetical protein
MLVALDKHFLISVDLDGILKHRQNSVSLQFVVILDYTF